jgi:metallo-beta-lactamase family protein
MKIQFCGAAQTVTGSQHLLTINDKKILLDCGLYQGKRSEAYDINRSFLFDPEELHCVILSHAHIDHSGNLPSLYAKGFKGDIYSTTATRDLCSIMLVDSAHIQTRDIEFVNKKRKREGEPLFKPLYDFDDVRNVMKQFKAVSYNKEFYIDGLDNNVKVRFYDAGHILGSSSIVLDITEKGMNLKLGFTGDLGRKNLPILKDPEFIGDVNYLITESTYGCKLHDNADQMEEQLTGVLLDALKKNGKIIVPAFSVGRTQEIVFALSKLFNRGALPPFPIYIDSPLSTNVSDVFKIHHECFDDETSGLLAKGIDVFGFSNLTYIRDVEESKALKDKKGTCMIIAASGMCEAGRVLHHLANHISDRSTTVLIIGFMAENTLGRRLIDLKDTPGSTVKIYGEEHILNCKVEVLTSFSAHADKNELVVYIGKFNKSELEEIFIVHGEQKQQECLKSNLENINLNNIFIPKKGDVLDL